MIVTRRMTRDRVCSVGEVLGCRVRMERRGRPDRPAQRGRPDRPGRRDRLVRRGRQVRRGMMARWDRLDQLGRRVRRDRVDRRGRQDRPGHRNLQITNHDMSATRCDECGEVMSREDLRQQRFRRGNVEIIVRAHFMGRSMQHSRLCRGCIVRAVSEPDGPLPPLEAPEGMHEVKVEPGEPGPGPDPVGPTGPMGP
jgi:hypothetical protein